MTDASGHPVEQRLRRLQEQVEAQRRAIQDKASAVESLRRRLDEANRKLEQSRGRAEALMESVRRREAMIETLNQRAAALTASVRALKEKVRTARHDPRATEALDHNSAGGMDAFFATHPEDPSYASFAEAVGAVLRHEEVPLDGRSIFDAGVGPGYMLAHLIKGRRPSRVAGIDFSSVGIDIARRTLPQGAFEVATLYEPIRGRHDVVLCTEVLEHLEHPDRALRHVLDAVAPGGCAFLSVPDGRVDWSGLHINFWSPESWHVFIGRHADGMTPSLGRFRATPTASYENNYALIRRPS